MTDATQPETTRFTTMYKLKKLVESSNPLDDNAAESINKYIVENIVPNVADDEGVSSSMLIYLAKRIVEPELEYDHIPYLLDLLANLEVIRRLAVDYAREALEKQRQLKARKPDIKLLNKAQEKKLKSFSYDEMDRDVRIVLLEEIVLELCRLYICYLWTSPKFYLVLRFMKKYFPANYVEEGDPFANELWQGVLHHGLTRTERERWFASGKEVKELIASIQAWDRERKAFFEKFGHSEEEIFGEGEFMSYTRDFNAKLGRVTNKERIFEALKGYLNEVQRVTNIIEELFPTAHQRFERAAAELLAREEMTQDRSV